MSGYGYGYGYSDYGYERYAQYGYYGSPHPYPNAALELTGPGSRAYISRAYSTSYAYETQAGGIYTHTTAHTNSGYVSQSSYTFSDGDYKLTQTYTHQNFEDTSGPQYGYGGYYVSYDDPFAYKTSSFVRTDNYRNGIDYSDLKISGSTVSQSGYIYSSYSHETAEFVGGHPQPGHTYEYNARSVTNPYGYSTYSSNASTF